MTVTGCMACDAELSKQKLETLQNNEAVLERKSQTTEVSVAAKSSKSSRPSSSLKRDPSKYGRSFRQTKEINGNYHWQTGEAKVFLFNRKWDGFTCTEEIERQIVEEEHDSKIAPALDRRAKWLSIQFKLKKQFFLMQAVNTGPKWFQDLSTNQFNLLKQMMEIVKTDLEEAIISRTQRALLDYGVYPPLPGKKVLKCMKMCQGSIVQFLFMIHKMVVDEEQEEFIELCKEAKREGKPPPQFSINERLLLSGVFQAHFPEFTRKLNLILPPAYVAPKLILPTRPRPPPKEVYESPYLEPQPIMPKVWYVQREEDRIYKEDEIRKEKLRIQKIHEEVAKTMAKYREEREEKIRAILMQKNQIYQHKKKSKVFEEGEKVLLPRERKSTYFKRSGSRLEPSDISRSKQHVRRNKRYMYEVHHEGLQTTTSFGGYFAGDNKLIKDSEGAQLKVRKVPRDEKITCLYIDDSFHPIPVLNTRIRIRCRDVATQTQDEPMFLPLVAVEQEYDMVTDLVGKTSVSVTTNTESEKNKTVKFDKHKEGLDKNVTEKVGKPDETTEEKPHDCIFPKDPLNVECTDPECQLLCNQDTIKMDEYEHIRKKIELLPPEEQLKAAIEFLKEKGDPVAILPEVEKTPWLMRWFEKRRGINVKLNEEQKADLLDKSMKFWDATYNRVSNISCPTLKVKKNLTYADKEWLLEIVEKDKEKYMRKLKQQLVHNARDYFPSFYVEYFNSPLNKTMRKTFFTYMASRELDSYVFRPWSEGETEKPMNSDQSNDQEEENS